MQTGKQMTNSSSSCLNKFKLNFYFLQPELKLSRQFSDLIIDPLSYVVACFYF